MMDKKDTVWCLVNSLLTETIQLKKIMCIYISTITLCQVLG